MPLPYPGAKRRIAERIALALRLPADRRVHYVEPFAGSASVAFDLMRTRLRLGSRVTLIDKDPGIVTVWIAVRDHADELCDAVARVRPSRALWERCREREHDTSDGVVAAALRKLVLHRLSYAYKGARGGPRHSRWLAGWSADYVRGQIRERHLLMRGFDVRFHHDALVYLRRVDADAYVYADPPWHRSGREWYRHADPALHGALARVLRGRQRWALHYDDTPAIRAVYESWCDVTALSIGELLITPRTRTRTLTHSEATRLGLARAKASGVVLGRPRSRAKRRTVARRL